jgi:hypothetical protein
MQININDLAHAKGVPGAAREAMLLMQERIAQQDAVITGLRLDIEVQEALQVSAYHAGMKLGWNCAVTDDREKYDRAIAGTEHIKELQRIREARAALSGKEQTDVD